MAGTAYLAHCLSLMAQKMGLEPGEPPEVPTARWVTEQALALLDVEPEGDGSEIDDYLQRHAELVVQ